MTAEIVPEEMAENTTKEVAETEIVTVKLAETKEVLKRKGPQLLGWLNRLKFSTFI